MTQNKCGMLEGVILHTMPRQNVISRMVTVIQYRIGAQYVPIAEANRMKTTHVAGTPRAAKTSQTTLRDRGSIVEDLLWH